ncbi:MAG: SCO family protein [Ignavibacteriales bacterium]|nr:SCO family protein [Ignavibacteriales bacterium]
MVFTNEKGEKVALKSLIDKPTILMFVYYKCPSICSPMLADVASQVRRVDLAPGKEYQLISISIDHNETWKDAAEKKKGILSSGAVGLPENSWHFLTGDSVSIRKITELAGITFTRMDDQIIHPGAIMAIAKDGMITRYIIGPKYLPFDIKMAVIEAMDGKTAPTVAKILKFCFNYDSESETYMLNVTRIFGVLIIFAAAIGLIFLVRKSKTKDIKEGA